jgi:hypothetical protein
MNAPRLRGSSLSSIFEGQRNARAATGANAFQRRRKTNMKTMAKLGLGAALATGLAVAAIAPANAGVSVGIGLGAPAYAPPPANCYDAYGAYKPDYCAYPAYYGYDGPVFVGGWWGGGYWHGRYFGRGYYDRGFAHRFDNDRDWRGFHR